MEEIKEPEKEVPDASPKSPKVISDEIDEEEEKEEDTELKSPENDG